MKQRFRRPWVQLTTISILAFALVVGWYGFSLASDAGRLPWQEDPTRIPITPFVDIPGFGAPAPTATSTPSTP